MDCTGDTKGGEVKHPCEALSCMTPRAPTIYDGQLLKWLCNRCWVKTAIPKPPKRP